KYDHGKQAGGRIESVYLFMIIGAFILFIASANFINLSTAKAMSRAKGVGIKKFLGATRNSLIGQFLTESVVLSVIAMIVALILVVLMLPYFNAILQSEVA